MKTLVIVIILVLTSACSSKAPHSNYDQDLFLPQETENFILIEKKVYEDPELGVSIRYEDKLFPEDSIVLHVYPIRSIFWDKQEKVLTQEMDYVFSDIDKAIEQKVYKSRDKEEREPFSFNAEQTSFSGLKASFNLTMKEDILLYSDSFIFIVEDKYVKFSTSFDSRFNKKLTGDAIVKELLPLIKVPAESPYMKNIRNAYKQKLQEDFIKQLIAETYKKSDS